MDAISGASQSFAEKPFGLSLLSWGMLADARATGSERRLEVFRPRSGMGPRWQPCSCGEICLNPYLEDPLFTTMVALDPCNA